MTNISLDPETRRKIEEILNTASDIFSRRAQVILAYDDGALTLGAARTAGISPGRARYWKRQFFKKGLAIFPYQSGLEKIEPDSVPLQVNNAGTGGSTCSLRSESESFDIKKKERKGKNQTNKQKKFEIPDLPFPALRTLPGVLPDDTLAEAGRKVFQTQFAVMLRHDAGARERDNIEAIHDMRVATRRMRSAFDVFAGTYRKKLIKPHLAGLRQLGRLLGSVRDLDVFLENANRYKDTLSEATRPELYSLFLMWEGQLEQARNRLIAYLDSGTYREFLLNFNYFVQTPGFAALQIPGETPVPSRVREIVPCLIYTRLAAVRAFTPMLNTASIVQLHALRIEFKKLRYVLENFIEILGAETRGLIDLTKRLQDHLGELHDADVACQILNKFLENWDIGQMGLQLSERQNPESLANYLAFQYAERHRLLVTFPDIWARFEQPEIMEKFAQAISVL